MPTQPPSLYAGTARTPNARQQMVNNRLRAYLASTVMNIPERMTTAERLALPDPENHRFVWDTDAQAMYYYDAGAWIVAGSGNDLVVPDLATLGGLDDLILDDYADAFVVTLQDTFRLDKTSTLTDDGITVVLPNSGTGRWLRMVEPDVQWVTQATWFIDSSAGDDEASGVDLSNPIKTIAEWTRRVGQTVSLVNDVTVVILSDPDINDPWNMEIHCGPHAFLMQGVRTAAWAVDKTVAAFSRDITLNNPGTMTTVEGWGDLSDLIFNGLVIFNSSATVQDGWCRIARDLGAGSARLSPVMKAPDGWYWGKPAPGDTFNVYTMSGVSYGTVVIESESGTAEIRDLRLLISSANGNGVLRTSGEIDVYFVVFDQFPRWTWISGVHNMDTGIWLAHCACTCHLGCHFWSSFESILMRSLWVNRASYLWMHGQNLIQGTYFGTNPNYYDGRFGMNEVAVFDVTGSLGLFDIGWNSYVQGTMWMWEGDGDQWPGPTDRDYGLYYGTSAGGYRPLVVIGSGPAMGSAFIYNGSKPIVTTGSGTPVAFAGEWFQLNRTWAQVPLKLNRDDLAVLSGAPADIFEASVSSSIESVCRIGNCSVGGFYWLNNGLENPPDPPAVVAPGNTVIGNLRVYAATPPGLGTLQVTLMVNGVSSGITVSLTGANQSAQSTATFIVNGGDRITVLANQSAGGAAANCTATFEVGV